MKKILIIILFLLLAGCYKEEEIVPSVEMKNIIQNNEEINFQIVTTKGLNQISNIIITLKLDNEIIKTINIDQTIQEVEEITFYNLLSDKSYTIEVIYKYLDKVITLDDYLFTVTPKIIPTAEIINPVYDKGKVTFDLMINDPDNIIEYVELRLYNEKNSESYSLMDQSRIMINSLNRGIIFTDIMGLRYNTNYRISVYTQYRINDIEYQKVLSEFSFFTGDFWLTKPIGTISNVIINENELSLNLSVNDPDNLINSISLSMSDGKGHLTYTNFEKDIPDLIERMITLNSNHLEYVKVNCMYSFQNTPLFKMLSGKGLSGNTIIYNNKLFFTNLYDNHYLFSYNLENNEVKCELNKSIYNMFLDGDNLIYMKSDVGLFRDVVKYNLVTKEETQYSLETKSIKEEVLYQGKLYYMYQNDFIESYDFISNMIETISLNYPQQLKNLRIFDDKIYVLISKKLHSLNLDGSGLEKILDKDIDSFEIYDGNIYYQEIGIISNRLGKYIISSKVDIFLADVDPKSIILFENKLYFYNNDINNNGIFSFDLLTNELKLIHKSVASRITIYNDRIFFYKSSSYDLVNGDCYFYSINLDGSNECLIG